MKTSIRSPICTVMGHVDHGKSSLLDKIRGSAITKTEAGGITQAIGASIIPIETIKKITGGLFEKIKTTKIPGLLFIDTPGHAAFNALRKRGGALADLAIVVVDVNEGMKPQTKETIEILKQDKTPFVVAANKIDLIRGWKSDSSISLLKNIEKQSTETVGKFEEKLYVLVAQLEEFGFKADRFDRASDFSKQLAVVPVSAMTGEGIPELLMMIIGLSSKFFEKELETDVSGKAKGVVLEVKESKGLGKTIDVILYDGKLSVKDEIVLGAMEGGIAKIVSTKIKALLEPAPLSEMRDKKTDFISVKEVVAATGVKIAANDLDNVVAGMPLYSVENEKEKQEFSAEIMSQIKEILIETGGEGIIIKADSLGSLEALIKLFAEENIPISKAGIGNVTKKDLVDAKSQKEFDIVLAFNTATETGVDSIAHESKVSIIKSQIIYELIDKFKAWKEEKQKEKEKEALSGLTQPCKIEFLRGYVFRQNNPAVFGVEVLAGKLKTGTRLMKASGEKIGKQLGTVKSIEHEKENVNLVESGKQVAISVEGVTIGRQVEEGDILYSFLTEEEFRTFKDNKQLLSHQEKAVLQEISDIMRKENPVWGV